MEKEHEGIAKYTRDLSWNSRGFRWLEHGGRAPKNHKPADFLAVLILQIPARRCLRATPADHRAQSPSGEKIRECVFSPHSLRATTATLLDSSVAIESVQDLLDPSTSPRRRFTTSGGAQCGIRPRAPGADLRAGDTLAKPSLNRTPTAQYDRRQSKLKDSLLPVKF